MRSRKRRQGGVTEVMRKSWSKRVEWANCGEPFKTDLNRIASQWIAGTISNEILAFHAVKLSSEALWIAGSKATHMPDALGDVRAHLRALTEAMLAVSLRPEADQTPETRREALDYMIAEFIPPEMRSR